MTEAKALAEGETQLTLSESTELRRIERQCVLTPKGLRIEKTHQPGDVVYRRELEATLSGERVLIALRDGVFGRFSLDLDPAEARAFATHLLEVSSAARIVSLG